jgi:hypothetical protein
MFLSLRPFWPQVFPAGRKEDRFKCYCDAKDGRFIITPCAGFRLNLLGAEAPGIRAASRGHRT